MSESAGVTVPARELHLLLGGLRSWYTRDKLPTDGSELRLEPREPVCLGVISGDSGTGKSLLVQSVGEVCSKLGFRHATATCFRDEGEPLEVVLDLLVDLFAQAPDVADGLSPVQRGLLSDLVRGRDNGDEYSPVPPLSPALDRSRRTDLLAETLLMFADAAPLVLAVEEMQWIDALSADVLAACLRMIRWRSRGEDRVPGLLVTTFRPAQIADATVCHEILEPRYIAFEINCRGYSRDDLQDLIEGLGLEEVPLSSREEIYQKTGGSTRSSRWLLQCLRDSGGGSESLSELVRGHGRWVDLERLVRGRYEALDPLERALVDTLSFLGRPAGVADLQALFTRLGPVILGAEVAGATSESSELTRVCLRLEASGWLRLASSGPDEGRWSLDGQDVQETIQKRWPASQRAQAHGEIARHFLDEREWEEDVSVLFTALHHLQRADRSDALFDVTRRAALLCEARQAHGRSVEIRDRLLENLDRLDPEPLLEVCLEQAGALCRAGVHREASDIYDSVLSGRLGTLSAEQRSECYEQLGDVYARLGEVSQELEAYAEGLRCLDEDVDPIRALSLHARVAEALLKRGAQRDLARHLERCVELVERLDAGPGGDGGGGEGDETVSEVDEALVRMEEVYFRLGRLPEAEAAQKRLLESARERENLEFRVRSLEHLSHLAFLRGDSDAAFEYLEQGLEGARALSSRLLEARFRRQFGRLHRAAGDLEAALSDGYAFCDAMLEIGREEVTPPVWGEVACAELELFRFERALETLASYVRLSCRQARAGAAHGSSASRPNSTVFFPSYRGQDERSAEIRTLRGELDRRPSDRVCRALADLLTDAGDSDEAGDLYRRCLKFPEIHGNPLSMAASLQRLGRWHSHRGQAAEALSYFEKSLVYLGPSLDRPLLGNAYLEVGNILAAQGSLRTAYSYLIRGLGLFLELSEPDGVCAGLVSLARFLRDSGRGEWCDRLARLVVQFASSMESPRWEAEGLLLGASVVADRESGEAARRMFARAGALFHGLGLRAKTCRLDIELGWHCVREHDFLRAEQHAKACLESARELRSGPLLQDSLHLLGVVESALGKRGKNFLRSLEVLQRAVHLSKASRRVLATRWVLASMARLYGERGKADLSREFLNKELALAERVRQHVPEVFWESYRREALRRVGSNEGEFAAAPVSALS